jgi:serine/threonine-protein kinase HipA
MSNGKSDEANVLKLTLHDRLVGYLMSFHDGRNILIFSNEFKNDASRPTLSLITSPKFPNSQRIMLEPFVTRQRLHPLLSNLLPEGAMRESLRKI